MHVQIEEKIDERMNGHNEGPHQVLETIDSPVPVDESQTNSFLEYKFKEGIKERHIGPIDLLAVHVEATGFQPSDYNLSYLSPRSSLPEIKNISTESLQEMLTTGTKMIKYPNKITSRPVERWVKVNMIPLRISWESKKKIEHSTGVFFMTVVDFHSILEIRMGQNTAAFETHGKNPSLEEKSFSIIYMQNGKYKTLNLG